MRGALGKGGEMRCGGGMRGREGEGDGEREGDEGAREGRGGWEREEERGRESERGDEGTRGELGGKGVRGEVRAKWRRKYIWALQGEKRNREAWGEEETRSTQALTEEGKLRSYRGEGRWKPQKPWPKNTQLEHAQMGPPDELTEHTAEEVIHIVLTAEVHKHANTSYHYQALRAQTMS
ncbi:MAG: hypothetical protein ACKESB_00040 [Candidatus Hodgkinia cicadicola]